MERCRLCNCKNANINKLIEEMEGDIDKAIDYLMRVKYGEWKNWKECERNEQRQTEEKV